MVSLAHIRKSAKSEDPEGRQASCDHLREAPASGAPPSPLVPHAITDQQPSVSLRSSVPLRDAGFVAGLPETDFVTYAPPTV